MAQVIFITATDTGAGKTLLTSLCVSMLLQTGQRAIAIKPFCSGSRDDVELLYRVQGGQISKKLINPFYFDESVAPLVAMRRIRRTIPIPAVNSHIEAMSSRCDWLLVEGAGGLLTPLGEGFDFVDLIASKQSRVIIVAQNRLGVINHSRLTINSLTEIGTMEIRFVLMDTPSMDLARRTNRNVLSEFLHPIPVFSLPHFGPRITRSPAGIFDLAKKLKKTLARLLGEASLPPALVGGRR